MKQNFQIACITRGQILLHSNLHIHHTPRLVHGRLLGIMRRSEEKRRKNGGGKKISNKRINYAIY